MPNKNTLPKGPIFVFQPGGVAGANLYIDWTTLYNAISAVLGPATVEVDSSLAAAHITTGGPYNLHEVTFVPALVQIKGKGQGILHIDDGATIAPGTLHILDGLTVIYDGIAPAVCVSGGNIFTLIDVGFGATLECSASGTTGAFVAASSKGAPVSVYVHDGAFLGDGVNLVVAGTLGNLPSVFAESWATISAFSIGPSGKIPQAVLMFDDTVTLGELGNGVSQINSDPHAWLFGTGSLGDVEISANTTSAGGDYTTFKLDAGFTLTATPNQPIIIRALQSITIDGQIVSDGAMSSTFPSGIVGQWIGEQVQAAGGGGGGGGGSGSQPGNGGQTPQGPQSPPFLPFGFARGTNSNSGTGGAAGGIGATGGNGTAGTAGSIGAQFMAGLTQLGKLPGGEMINVLFGIPGSSGMSGGVGGPGAFGPAGATGGASGTNGQDAGQGGGNGATSIFLISPSITFGAAASLSAQGAAGATGATGGAGGTGGATGASGGGGGGGGGGAGGGQGGNGGLIVVIGYNSANDAIPGGVTGATGSNVNGGAGGPGGPGGAGGAAGAADSGPGGSGATGANGATGGAGFVLTVPL